MAGLRDLRCYADVYLGGSEAGELCTTKGEGCGYKDGAEPFEAVFEWLVRGVPVPGSNIASRVTLDATTIVYDAEDDESYACKESAEGGFKETNPLTSQNLAHRQEELDFTISSKNLISIFSSHSHTHTTTYPLTPKN